MTNSLSTENLFRSIVIATLILLVTSARAATVLQATNDIPADVRAIKEQLATRLSPAEAALLDRVNTLEKKIQKSNPWLDQLPALIAFVVGLIGWVKFLQGRRQRTWELLLESLRWFEGGTQARSIGIALVESKWDHHEEFRSRWTAILINQAIYLLTRKKSRSAIHERANLYRIMDLLVTKVGNDIGQRERELLKTTLEDYPNLKRGLKDVNEESLRKWKTYFKCEEKIRGATGMEAPITGGTASL